MKCRLCGIEKATRREMHGHMMLKHHDDYERSGFDLDRVCDDVPERKHDTPAMKNARANHKKVRPAGFRFLSKSDRAEAYAIQEGFSYIDEAGNIYTVSDAKGEGWI